MLFTVALLLNFYSYAPGALALVDCGPPSCAAACDSSCTYQACDGTASVPVNISQIPVLYTSPANACADGMPMPIKTLPMQVDGATIKMMPISISHSYNVCQTHVVSGPPCPLPPIVVTPPQPPQQPPQPPQPPQPQPPPQPPSAFGVMWVMRDVGWRDPVLLAGKFSVLREPGGALCDEGYQSMSFAQGYQTFVQTHKAVPGGPADCPNRDGTGPQVFGNLEGGSCSSIGSKCMWSSNGPWVPLTAPSQIHNIYRKSTCNYIECVDTSKCPDGSTRQADNICPNTSGKWYIRNMTVPGAASLPGCDPGLANGLPCSPIGQKCKYPYAIPPAIPVMECMQ